MWLEMVLVTLTVFIIALILSAACLWVSGKIMQVPRLTFVRSCTAVLIVNVAFLALAMGLVAVLPGWWALVGLGFAVVVQMVLPFLAIWLVGRTSLVTTLLVGLLWHVFGMVAAVPLTIVMVLAIRHFVEAFVVPTGAMAETIRGYHKTITCPQCGHTFLVNASSEADPSWSHKTPVTGCTCPNCRYAIDFQRERLQPLLESGDHFLAWKSGAADLQRFDVVVFQYPDASPDQSIRYIMRLTGLPGETLGTYFGDLYTAEGLHTDAKGQSTELRKLESLFKDADADQLKRDAVTAESAADRKFRIIRKTPEQILARRWLVFDNDHPARDLVGKPPRWAPENSDRFWQGEPADQPRTFSHGKRSGGVAWLRYRHLPRTDHPELITDFISYNSSLPNADPHPNWVGDLILECQVNIVQAESELRLELVQGVDCFQARFRPADGTCSLVRLADGAEKELAMQTCSLKGTGPHQVRFANVDRRLTVWVDNDLPFGDGVDYDPPAMLGPTDADLSSAGIGALTGEVKVAQLRLWRDVHYTTGRPFGPDVNLPVSAWSDPQRWDPIRQGPAATWFVHPGHYFVLGDNSPESSDSRYWGLVPEKMLIGKAVYYYFPLERIGPIR